MIYEVLNFLKGRLDAYLTDGRTNAEPLIVLSGPWTSSDAGKGASFLNSVSLIHIEEEKIFKTQTQPITRSVAGFYTKREPDLKLNLYLLISAYNKSYEDALKFISRVVTYFQANSVFAPNGDVADDLPEEVEKIVMELYTASFEQQNQIWASMSTGYLPSVIYKVRTITVDAGKESEEQKRIEEISVRTRLLQKTNGG